jgi:lipopolysaccharide/colanic/teichoic acid biosynthesis glycosyltransferase
MSLSRHVLARASVSARTDLIGTSAWATDIAAVTPDRRRPAVATIDPSRFEELPICDHRAPDNVLDSALGLKPRIFKRIVDVVVGGVAVIATAPLVAAAAIAIYVESGGPVLFKQVRPGLNGRSFCLLKLRTMHVGNDDGEHRAYLAALIGGTGERQGGMFKLHADPRVTRVGRVLRRYSIDELPQLLNVLRGEMSLVGPRPPVPAELDHYDAEHWLRLRVKPGMTGAWQVSGRCERTYAEMVALDVDYWRRWSVRSELRILFQTLPCVLTARGAA